LIDKEREKLDFRVAIPVGFDKLRLCETRVKRTVTLNNLRHPFFYHDVDETKKIPYEDTPFTSFSISTNCRPYIP
jgi:hypothetical protein